MSVCSLRWFAEDVLSVGRWLVRETTDEVHSRFWKALERIDTRLQPSHVRRAWDGMLAEEAVERVRAEAQGVTEVVEAPDDHAAHPNWQPSHPNQTTFLGVRS